ncbi:hypothetical protein [Pseudomonas aeruginosa]|uniref:hypothetical protein n=1 Tax=Pseudomonas aeruginosa TaxID=287 RepID=UPI0038B830D5
MREEFEAWASACGFTLSPDQNNCGIIVPERYGHPSVQRCWEAWQASRAALKVELPKSDYADQLDGDAYVMESRAVAEALQKAGIEVK